MEASLSPLCGDKKLLVQEYWLLFWVLKISGTWSIGRILKMFLWEICLCIGNGWPWVSRLDNFVPNSDAGKLHKVHDYLVYCMDYTNLNSPAPSCTLRLRRRDNQLLTERLSSFSCGCGAIGLPASSLPADRLTGMSLPFVSLNLNLVRICDNQWAE